MGIFRASYGRVGRHEHFFIIIMTHIKVEKYFILLNVKNTKPIGRLHDFFRFIDVVDGT